MKMISVYMRNKCYYVVPKSKTTAGIHINVEPISVLSDDAPNEILGENIMVSFSFSNENVPHPNPKDKHSVSNVLKPLLLAAKVNSLKAFMDGSEMILLKKVDDLIRLIPSINGGYNGPKRGYRFDFKNAYELSAECSFTELGKTIKEMFQDIVDNVNSIRPQNDSD